MVSDDAIIDVSSIPELVRILAEQETVVLVRRGAHHATVQAVREAKPAGTRRRKGRPTSEADPLWKIVGMADSQGPGDVTENVDVYLANAALADGR
jgi:hypothetical protein